MPTSFRRWLTIVVAVALLRVSWAKEPADGYRTGILRGPYFSGLVLSPDGTSFVSSPRNSGPSPGWSIYDVATGKELRAFEGARAHVFERVAPQFSPDGSLVAFAEDRHVRVFDSATGKLRLDVSRPEAKPDPEAPKASPGDSDDESDDPDEDARVLESVKAFFFAPSSKVLGTINGKGTLTAAVIDSGKLLDVQLRTPVGAVVTSPDGRLIVDRGTDDFPLQMWDFESGKRVMSIVRAARGACAISPDGGTLFVGTEIWSVKSGGLRARLADAHVADSGVFSPDGRWLLTDGDDGRVMVWDALDGTRKAMARVGGGRVRGLSIDAAGRRVAVLARNGSVHLFDLPRLIEFAPMDGALSTLNGSPAALDAFLLGREWGTSLIVSARGDLKRAASALASVKKNADALGVPVEVPSTKSLDAVRSVEAAGSVLAGAVEMANGPAMGALFRLAALLSVWQSWKDTDTKAAPADVGRMWGDAREKLVELSRIVDIAQDAIEPVLAALEVDALRQPAVQSLLYEVVAHAQRLRRSAGLPPDSAPFQALASIPMAVEAFDFGRVWIKEIHRSAWVPAAAAFPAARAIGAVLGVKLPDPPAKTPESMQVYLGAFDETARRIAKVHGEGAASLFGLGTIIARADFGYTLGDSKFAEEFGQRLLVTTKALSLPDEPFSGLIRLVRERFPEEMVRKTARLVTADLEAALLLRPVPK